MSDTQTLEGIKQAAPEGATHYHIGLQVYLKKFPTGWFYNKPTIGWIKTKMTDGKVDIDIELDEIIVITNIPADDMTESMPFELLQDDQEPEGRKDDSAKPRFDLIPPRAQEAMARVLTSGAARYGENNWKQVEPLEQRYLAAAMRHLNALSRGEITDPDTGEHHGAHVMCCAAFLVEHHAMQKEQAQ